jgi:hypothetical protein
LNVEAVVDLAQYEGQVLVQLGGRRDVATLLDGAEF